MDKDKILKAFYLSQISKLIERCRDPSLIDLIYRLLIAEAEEEEQNENKIKTEDTTK